MITLVLAAVGILRSRNAPNYLKVFPGISATEDQILSVAGYSVTRGPIFTLITWSK